MLIESIYNCVIIVLRDAYCCEPFLCDDQVPVPVHDDEGREPVHDDEEEREHDDEGERVHDDAHDAYERYVHIRGRYAVQTSQI